MQRWLGFLKKKPCYFGMPKYILIDNGSEWMKKFDFFVKTMELFTNSLHRHGHNGMEWWNS
jgi:hypothetical protein